jgi:ABC-type glycerol-3-phosphate transport system substrate-binding protein
MARMTRRALLGWSLALGGGALLSACGGAASPTGAPAAAKPPAEPAKPAEKPAAAPTTAPAPAATTAPAAAAAATKPAAAEAKPAADAKPAAASAKPAAQPAGVKQGVTIRMHMRSGGEKSEPAIYVDRPTEWEQETGNKVKLEPTPGGKDYVPKILTLAASGSLGETLFTGDSDSGHTHLVRSNVIEPVDAFLDAFGVKKTEWLKPIVDQLTHDGKMYGLPKTGHPGEPFIWVNLTMFDKAGIKRPPIKGATFDDIRTWANAFSKGPKDKREVYGYYTSVRGAQGFTTGVRMRGGDTLDESGKAGLMDQEPWWQWAQWNSQLINEDMVHPTVQDNGAELPPMFAAGKLGMFHGARFLHFLTKTQVKDAFDWMVIQYPRPAGANGWMTVVDTHSATQAAKEKETAFSLIKAMSDRRFAYLVGKTQGYLTGRVDAIDALKEVAEDQFVKLQYECGPDQVKNWRPVNLRFYEIEAEVNNRMDEIWLGKKKLDKGHMAELKKAVDGILARPAL